uniref:Aldo_ket_red domain-containing protein n=1 Tax=Macrostomum lignano TaxID=282301 RepID=A0A1I8FMY8_9PLAT
GTFRIRGFDVIDACLDAALGAGYRGIDTSRSLPKRGRDRVGSVRRTRRAGPPPQRPRSRRAPPRELARPRRAAIRWQAAPHRASATTSCTISRSCARYTKTPCAVLQTECHPMLQRRDLRDYCANQGIHFQAYSSLGSTDYCQQLMQHPTLCSNCRLFACSTAAPLGCGFAASEPLPKSIRRRLILLRTPRLRCGFSPLPDEVHSLWPLWTADSTSAGIRGY